jgi:hypothetical protein
MFSHHFQRIHISLRRREAKHKLISFNLFCILTFLLTACTVKPAVYLKPAELPQSPSPSISTPAQNLPVIPEQPLLISPADVQPSEFSLSDYTLHAPSEQELNQQIYMLTDDWMNDYRYFDSPYSNFRQSLRQEYILRFQDSNDLDKVRWGYVLQNPLDPLSSPDLTTLDVFASQLEKELDTGQTSIETLTAWLSDHGFETAVFEPVQNLVGNEKNGFILQIMIDANSMDELYLSRFYAAVYALYQDADKKYHLANVSPWSLQYHNRIDILSVDDINSDDKADLAIKTEGFPGGSDAGACYSRIDIYSWNSQVDGFVNLTDEIPSLYGYQDNCTNNWQFGKPDENGSQPLIMTEQFYVEKGEAQEVECPPYQSQTAYFWTGDHFAKGETSVLELLDDTDASCKIAWAVNGNYQNGQAISILKSALEDPSNEQDIIDALGPAGVNYARFLLAIWLDQRNEDAQADIFLQTIPEPGSDTSAVDLLHFVQLYRETRSQKGKLTACLTVDQKLAQVSLDIAAEKYLTLSRASQGGLALKGVLGLIPAVWDQSWSFSICDPAPVLEAELSKVNPETADEMSAWLVQNGIPSQHIQPSDLDGDGRQDWVVVIPHLQTIDPLSSDSEIWGFLQQGSELKPVLIGRDYLNFDEIPSTPVKWESITTPGLIQPQNILLIDNQLYIFTIDDHASMQSLLPKYQNFLYPARAFSITSENGTLKLQVVFDAQTCTGGCADRETYQWDTISRGWILSESDPLPQAERIRKIEDQLFTQQNDQSAIDLIDSWLDEGVSDPEDAGYPPQSNDYTRSYLRYLLGLAFERSGQPEKAVQTYYELWKDNPPNVFGYLASTRLERK